MIKTLHFFCFLLVAIGSCTASKTTAPSATPYGPRTLIIGAEKISEEDAGGFTSWYCKDFLNRDRVVVEVGFFNDTLFDFLGFLLYDGGYTGEVAFYRRIGLEHRWEWGENAAYSFVLKTDGTGLYYDFSAVSEGEATKARAVYKCYQR
ncbi:hypothetical protein QLX67_10000 [Balneolaceae bacterium ANBcel3]|nr:hypothetical protein [Balneolaceae bacterium ANBcel3]